MGSLLDEDILEYPLTQRWQGGRQGRQPPSASPMPQPIDGQVAYHHDEPGGDRSRRIDGGGAATQAGEIVVPEPFADYCADVHHVVVVSDEVADCSEDKPPVALDEEIPCGLEIPPLERDSPRLSHDRGTTILPQKMTTGRARTHSAGFAIGSPRGMGEPHDFAPRGS